MLNCETPSLRDYKDTITEPEITCSCICVAQDVVQ